MSAVVVGAVAIHGAGGGSDASPLLEQTDVVDFGAQPHASRVAEHPAWVADALEVPSATPVEHAGAPEVRAPDAGVAIPDGADALPIEGAAESPAPADPGPQVPTATVATLQAGGDAVTVATMSGTGAVALGFARASSSAAPNLPTYVSTICDGASVYAGAFNTTSEGPVVEDVPYSGTDCAVNVRVAQPSARWTGTSSTIVVTSDAPEAQSGAPFVGQAEWITTAVDTAGSFGIAVPDGFTGAVSLKLTACSSEGGTSDATREFACGAMVQEGVGTEGTITVSDDVQVLAEAAFDISADTHHDMVTVQVDDPAAGDLTIWVERNGGSAVLVHGPGTGAVGTH